MTSYSDLPDHVFYPMFSELSDYASHAVAKGGQLITANDPGNHTTNDSSALAIVTRPVGSGNNSPTCPDFGLSISAIKQNWSGPTAAIGQIEGVNVVVRNGGPVASPSVNQGQGSDSCAYLGNIFNVFGTGYVSGYEAIAGNVDPTTLLPRKSVTVQLTPVNGVPVTIPGGDTAYGMVINANNGALDTAVQIQSRAGASWANALIYNGPNGTLFSVGGDGNVSIQGTQVLGAQIKGYAARLAALNAGTETPTAILTQLITDLMTHGLIGQ